MWSYPDDQQKIDELVLSMNNNGDLYRYREKEKSAWMIFVNMKSLILEECRQFSMPQPSTSELVAVFREVCSEHRECIIMNNQAWKPEDESLVLKEFCHGASIEALAHRMGRSTNSILCRLASKNLIQIGHMHNVGETFYTLFKINVNNLIEIASLCPDHKRLVGESWLSNGMSMNPAVPASEAEVMDPKDPQEIPEAPPITQEKIMNTSKPVVVVTYLFGKNIDELPENELIDALRNIEKKIDSLKEYKTPSTRIDQIIAEHEEAIQVILTRLDSGAEAK